MPINEKNQTLYSKISANRRLILSWVVLILGIFLTGLVCHQVKTNIELFEHSQFEMRCNEIALRINMRMLKHKQMLLSGAAMFDASENVTRKEWRVYVKRLSLSRDLDGVQALGFSLWIKPEQLKAHEESVQKEGFPDYRVKPEGKRDVYTSILYIEPFQDRNLRAFGYDMYSEPVRHEAIDKAIDSEDVSLSNKVILLQENETDIQAGTLMYAPVYQKNKPLNTVEQRRKSIFGLVYSPFRMTDLLRDIVVLNERVDSFDLNLAVYDGNEINEENLLYQNHDYRLKVPPIFSFTIPLELYGATWTLHFEQFANAEKKIDYLNVWISLISGAFISFLLFFLLRSHFFMLKNARKIAFGLTTQLRESEERFRLLADSAPVMIWTAGTDKMCDYFNKVWLDFTGHTLEQLQGNGWSNDVHPDDLARCLKIYSDAFDARKPFKMEYRLKHHDGTYHWLLDNGVPRFGDNKFIGYIGSCVDITERHQIEMNLQNSERQLAISNADLVQFTQISAHHLQEPARRLVGFAQRLQNELSAEISANEEAAIMLRFIEQSAVKQRALVRDIQLYLAATLPRSEIKLVSVENVLTKVVKYYAPLIQKTNAHIEYGALPDVWIDYPRVYDIFSILLDNALHYLKPNDLPKIRIYGELIGERVRYYVEDCGIGIPAEYRERVFLVFERLNVKENQESTGIGLAIAKRIVESCNGSINLSETQGGGTTAIFDLPKDSV